MTVILCFENGDSKAYNHDLNEIESLMRGAEIARLEGMVDENNNEKTTELVNFNRVARAIRLGAEG